MSMKERLIREILEKGKTNGWDEYDIAKEIWDAAVEWASDYIGYGER